MWLVAGLGNPGRRYEKTRHNVGFMVLEELAAGQRAAFRETPDCRIANGSIGDERIVLMEPLTFMNRSGSAVVRVMKKFSIPPERMIVVQDDLDLMTGRIKIRRNGSSGGHKGIQSIIEQTGSREFIRVKIGIGRQAGVPTEEHVLSRFGKDEAAAVKEAVMQAASAVCKVIEEGIDKAMNHFN